MKQVLTIVFWLAAVLTVAAVVMSIGYSFTESIFIGTLFLPGALAVKFFYPKISFDDKASGIKNTIFITIGVILGEILLFIMVHFILQVMRNDVYIIYNLEKLPDLLSNPIFIAIIIAVLSIGNYYFEKWIEKRLPSERKPVTFFSDRKSVSLMTDEILFIESNDTVTTVVATEERRYRNKTPISHWESILGDDFIRIHRSYLVNKVHIETSDKDSVTVSGGYELPISSIWEKKRRGRH